MCMIIDKVFLSIFIILSLESADRGFIAKISYAALCAGAGKATNLQCKSLAPRCMASPLASTSSGADTIQPLSLMLK